MTSKKIHENNSEVNQVGGLNESQSEKRNQVKLSVLNITTKISDILNAQLTNIEKKIDKTSLEQKCLKSIVVQLGECMRSDNTSIFQIVQRLEEFGLQIRNHNDILKAYFNTKNKKKK